MGYHAQLALQFAVTAAVGIGVGILLIVKAKTFSEGVRHFWRNTPLGRTMPKGHGQMQFGGAMLLLMGLASAYGSYYHLVRM